MAKSKQELQDMFKGKKSSEGESEGEKEESEGKDEKEEVKEEEKYEQKVKGALDAAEGAPSKEQIEKWKAEYGSVYVSAFSEKEVFIWRVLNRAEHRQLQLMLSKMTREDFSQADYEEMIVDTVMLWPKVNEGQYQKLTTTKAGTYSSLHEQIMQASNFVSGPMAAMLMAEL